MRYIDNGDGIFYYQDDEVQDRNNDALKDRQEQEQPDILPPMPVIPEPIPPMPEIPELQDKQEEVKEEAKDPEPKEEKQPDELRELRSEVEDLKGAFSKLAQADPVIDLAGLDEGDIPILQEDDAVEYTQYTDSENDHSWHYDVGTNTITQGSVFHGDNSASPLSFPSDPTPGYFDSTPADTTSIIYYVKVDWSSSHTSPTITWTDSDTETEADDDEIVLYKILEFDSGGVCTERCQCDIHLPEVFIPKPPDRECVLWFDYSTNKYKYTTTDPQDYMVLSYKSVGTGGNGVDFDWPRFNAETP